MLRFVSSLLIALALLLSPLAMAGGGAAAAYHGPAAVMATDSHCAATEAPVGKDRSDAKLSCAVTCAAFVAAEPAAGSTIAPGQVQAVAARDQLLIGIHLEGETPPPRITPEI